VSLYLETQRLVMREVRASDREAWIRLTGDPKVWRYIAAEPLDAGQAWEKLLIKAGTYALTGLGNWVVCERGSGEVLGEVGFFDAHRGIAGTDGMIEVGWSYFPHVWGQGIATEAGRAAHEWFGRAFPDVGTFAIINADNMGSLRVAQKCGYVEDRRYDDDRGGQVVMTRGGETALG